MWSPAVAKQLSRAQRSPIGSARRTKSAISDDRIHVAARVVLGGVLLAAACRETVVLLWVSDLGPLERRDGDQDVLRPARPESPGA
jgi:hypothetical protein